MPTLASLCIALAMTAATPEPVQVITIDGATRAECYVPTRAITGGELSHWFGYYDKDQFDPSGRYVLGQAVDHDTGLPSPTDTVQLGMVDLRDNDKWIPLGTTNAWCWQQGCMLQWLPGTKNKVIYNERQNDRFVAVIQDVKTGERRVLPRAIYSVSLDGKWATSFNISRLYAVRPGYSYVGVDDHSEGENWPDDDGLYVMNLETGDAKLIVTLAQLYEFERTPEEGEGIHWINVMLFNADSTRICFLHRWVLPEKRGWVSRFLTVNLDGSDMYIINDHKRFSHLIWRDAAHILAFSYEPPQPEMRFHLFTDRTEQVEDIGWPELQVEGRTADGHCTYSPDGKWVLVDTYPNREGFQYVRLYRPSDKTLVPLGRFWNDPKTRGEWRTDLHPRWDREGKFVCIDSSCSGQRQMYLLDVSKIVHAE